MGIAPTRPGTTGRGRDHDRLAVAWPWCRSLFVRPSTGRYRTTRAHGKHRSAARYARSSRSSPPPGRRSGPAARRARVESLASTRARQRAPPARGLVVEWPWPPAACPAKGDPVADGQHRGSRGGRLIGVGLAAAVAVGPALLGPARDRGPSASPSEPAVHAALATPTRNPEAATTSDPAVPVTPAPPTSD